MEFDLFFFPTKLKFERQRRFLSATGMFEDKNGRRAGWSIVSHRPLPATSFFFSFSANRRIPPANATFHLRLLTHRPDAIQIKSPPIPQVTGTIELILNKFCFKKKILKLFGRVWLISTNRLWIRMTKRTFSSDGGNGPMRESHMARRRTSDHPLVGIPHDRQLIKTKKRSQCSRQSVTIFPRLPKYIDRLTQSTLNQLKFKKIK